MSTSTPPSRRTSADWPIDPALASPGAGPSRRRSSALSSQPQAEAGPSRPRRISSQPPPEAGPSRPRRSSPVVELPPRSNRRGRPPAEDEDELVEIVPERPEKRARQARSDAQRREGYRRGWETRRHNIWAERVLPTYSAGLDRDYSNLPADFLLDSLHRHAAEYYAARGLLKEPKRPWLSRPIQPNQKRRLLERAGAVARSPLAKAHNRPSPEPTDAGRRANGDRGEGGEEGEGEEVDELEGDGEKEDERETGEYEDELHEEKSDEEEPRRLRPRSSNASQPAAAASGSESDASVAYRPAGSGSEAEEDELDASSSSRTPTPPPAPVPPAAHTTTDTASRTRAAQQAEREREEDEAEAERERRGPYIRRDMRHAVEGAGLLALGVVVEELIRYQLELAGYERAPARRETLLSASEDDSDDDDEGDSDESDGF